MIFQGWEAVAAYEDREMAVAASLARALYVLLAEAHEKPERRAALSDLAGALVEQIMFSADQANAPLHFLAPEAIDLGLDTKEVAKRARVYGSAAAVDLATAFADSDVDSREYLESVRRVVERLAAQRGDALRPTPPKPKAPRRSKRRELPAHLRVEK